MKKEIILYPTISSNETLVQFTSEITIDKNVLINVPSDFTAFIYLNQKLAARINSCNDTNLLKYLGKEYNGSKAKIAFIKKNDIPPIPWGFGEINVKNEKLAETYRVGTNGKYTVKIKDAAKLIYSFGSDENIDIEKIGSRTKYLITTVGKPLLSGYFANSSISVFEINSLVDDLRKKMIDCFHTEEGFSSCGLEISDLSINGIHVDEDDMELIRSRINGITKSEEYDSSKLDQIKKEIIDSIKKSNSAEAMMEIQNLKTELANIAESQATDTILDEIDNLRTELSEAIKNNRKNTSDPRLDSLISEIDELKTQLNSSNNKSAEVYAKQTKKMLDDIEQRLSNKIDENLFYIKSVLENSVDENSQKSVPLYETAKEEWLKNLKITTDLLLEKSESDDDFASVAGLICSNVENNLMNKFNIPHKNKDFYMSIKEFNDLSDSIEVNGKKIFKDSYKPRHIEFDDLSGDFIEMPLEIRFIKTGINAKDSLQAARDWTVLNKFRHRSEENSDKLKIILADRKKDKKGFLDYVLKSYRNLGLYTRD